MSTGFRLALTQGSFSYIALKLIGQKPPAGLPDYATITLTVKSALIQFLGLTGAAISFDIICVHAKYVLMRVSRFDASALMAAVGGWNGRSSDGQRNGEPMMAYHVLGHSRSLIGLLSIIDDPDTT